MCLARDWATNVTNAEGEREAVLGVSLRDRHLELTGRSPLARGGEHTLSCRLHVLSPVDGCHSRLCLGDVSVVTPLLCRSTHWLSENRSPHSGQETCNMRKCRLIHPVAPHTF